MGGKLLQRVSQSDIDATHTVVITNESPLQFSHSTEHRTNGTGAGVEYNVDLKTYLQSNSADVIQLETTNAMKENAKKYIANKTGEEDAKNAKYDYLAAV